MIYAKTETGQQVVKDRSVPLTPRQRSAFILFDGKRTVEVYNTVGDSHTNELSVSYIPAAKILIEARDGIVDGGMVGVLAEPVGKAVPIVERRVALADQPVDGARFHAVDIRTHRTVSVTRQASHTPYANRLRLCSG